MQRDALSPRPHRRWGRGEAVISHQDYAAAAPLPDRATQRSHCQADLGYLPEKGLGLLQRSERRM